MSMGWWRGGGAGVLPSGSSRRRRQRRGPPPLDKAAARRHLSGPPPAVQYCRELEKHCCWGNEVELYKHHVDALFAMFRHKKPYINYYVCTINRTFAKPGQRMYFQVYYTKENLKEYIHPDDVTLKVRLANSSLHTDCRIMLGTDKRATITRNWSEFRSLANIREGDICAFRFKVTTEHRLVLIVHRL